jgi:hypothetical protein
LRKWRLEWFLVAGSLGLGALLVTLTRGTEKAPLRGSIEFTVTPDDATGLTCALPNGFAELRCAYQDPKGSPSEPAPSESERIAPYVTVRRELVLVAGVFSHEAVRAEAARREELPKPKQRFHVTCDGLRLARVEHAWVRFGRGEFRSQGPSWVWRATSCKPLPAP